MSRKQNRDDKENQCYCGVDVYEENSKEIISGYQGK